jgi:hypothetical protein
VGKLSGVAVAPPDSFIRSPSTNLLLLVVGGRLGHGQPPVDEAVNDHLRVLYAERPLKSS